MLQETGGKQIKFYLYAQFEAIQIRCLYLKSLYLKSSLIYYATTQNEHEKVSFRE